MQTVRAVLSGTGEANHPSLKKFIAEANLYKHVGLNFNDLRDRPYREVLDYVTIASMITAEDNRQARQQAAESNKGSR